MLDFLDAYSRRARLTPGLLLLAPIALGALSVGLVSQPVVAVVGGLLVAVGGPVLLAALVGERGRRLESELKNEWGGFPTSTFLLHATSTRSAAQRKAWRTNLERVSGQTLRTAGEELADPTAAVQEYDLLIDSIRARTRDSAAYPLVLEESCNYGFWRNLRALRTAGLWLSAATTVVLGGLFVAYHTEWVGVGGWANPASLAVGILLSAGWWAGWLVLPSKGRVRAASERYAERLLETLFVL